MRYTWDLNKLINNKKRLEDILKNKDKYAYSEIEVKTTLELYNQLLPFLHKSNFDILDESIENEDIISILCEANEFYTPENQRILNVLMPALLPIKDIRKKLDLNNIGDFPKTGDNNEEFKAAILYFFNEMTSKDIFKKVEEALNPNNHIIHFFNDKNDSRYPAITVLDYINKTKIIGVQRSNTCIDYESMIHELFHYIFCDINNYSAINTHPILAEIEGRFGDILFSYYFKQKTSNIDGIDNELFNRKQLAQFDNEIRELVIVNFARLAVTDNGKFRFNKLNKAIDGLNMPVFTNSEGLYDYINTPIKENTTYALAYLTAIDLFYIYLRDKEYAFYLLKNIKSSYSERNILSLLYRNDITFMVDNYENLKKYIKFKD